MSIFSRTARNPYLAERLAAIKPLYAVSFLAMYTIAVCLDCSLRFASYNWIRSNGFDGRYICTFQDVYAHHLWTLAVIGCVVLPIGTAVQIVWEKSSKRLTYVEVTPLSSSQIVLGLFLRDYLLFACLFAVTIPFGLLATCVGAITPGFLFVQAMNLLSLAGVACGIAFVIGLFFEKGYIGAIATVLTVVVAATVCTPEIVERPRSPRISLENKPVMSDFDDIPVYQRIKLYELERKLRDAELRGDVETVTQIRSSIRNFSDRATPGNKALFASFVSYLNRFHRSTPFWLFSSEPSHLESAAARVQAYDKDFQLKLRMLATWQTLDRALLASGSSGAADQHLSATEFYHHAFPSLLDRIKNHDDNDSSDLLAGYEGRGELSVYEVLQLSSMWGTEWESAMPLRNFTSKSKKEYIDRLLVYTTYRLISAPNATGIKLIEPRRLHEVEAQYPLKSTLLKMISQVEQMGADCIQYISREPEWGPRMAPPAPFDVNSCADNIAHQISAAGATFPEIVWTQSYYQNEEFRSRIMDTLAQSVPLSEPSIVDTFNAERKQQLNFLLTRPLSAEQMFPTFSFTLWNYSDHLFDPRPKISVDTSFLTANWLLRAGFLLLILLFARSEIFSHPPEGLSWSLTVGALAVLGLETRSISLMRNPYSPAEIATFVFLLLIAHNMPGRRLSWLYPSRSGIMVALSSCVSCAMLMRYLVKFDLSPYEIGNHAFAACALVLSAGIVFRFATGLFCKKTVSGILSLGCFLGVTTCLIIFHSVWLVWAILTLFSSLIVAAAVRRISILKRRVAVSHA